MDVLYRFIQVCRQNPVTLEDCGNPIYEEALSGSQLYLPVLLCSSVAITTCCLILMKPLSVFGSGVEWEDILTEEEQCSSEAMGDGDLLNVEPPLELYNNAVEEDKADDSIGIDAYVK